MSDIVRKKSEYDQFSKKNIVENNRKSNFIEIIHSMQDIMEKSGSLITKEEVSAYFKDMDLSKQQHEVIYEYLRKTQEKKTDEASMELAATIEKIDSAKCQTANMKTKLPDTDFFRLYLEDLKKIVRCTKEEEVLLYERLIKGDTVSVHKLSEQWLHKVLQIAQNQKAPADPKEFADVIQEGNMGVFLALQQMLGSGKRIDFEKELSEAARSAMERYMQKTADDVELDQSLLAKAALVYEAQKFLTEQFQRLPSVIELSQYTKIPETELEDILAILEEKK